MSVWVAGAVVVAGVGSAVVQGNAAKKAQAAQNAALNGQKGVDIEGTQQLAREADRQNYREQYNLLREVDPETYALLTGTNQQLAQYATPEGDVNQANADRILQSLYSENAVQSPQDIAFENTLRQRAQSQLDLGGALSPEQQAEIVRAGLEGASTTGLNAGSAATRSSVGSLVASEQLAQQQQRQSMAQELFGFATDLKNNRNSTLTGVAQAGLAGSAAKGSKLTGLANLADSRVPQVGLSGGDIANLAVGNQNQSNAVAAQRGAIGAQNAQAQGQIAAGLIGSLGSAAGYYGANRGANLSTGKYQTQTANIGRTGGGRQVAF